MFCFKAYPAVPGDAAATLQQLISPHMDPASFQSALRRLRSISDAFVASCPSPWPAPGLAVTPEINCQSELWLPLAVIRPVFDSLYRYALKYPPILTSTPFAGQSSWATVVAGLPEFMHQHSTPFQLLQSLLADDDLRTKFIFWSFMPYRFYGSGSDRYPGQTAFLREWLKGRSAITGGMRCLDAACGDGESSYALAALVAESDCGICAIEGWTVEPLEAWAAAHRCFPHDLQRQVAYRQATEAVFSRGEHSRLSFLQADLLNPPVSGQFDLIICNGLLGGPIIHEIVQMRTIVQKLSGLLRPGGLLLAGDHFHGGWKKRIPTTLLGELFRERDLRVREAGEGLAACTQWDM